ncbi:MAG TPA: isochorismatase family protein [Candidatus Limnocylindrales bacterium]|nr:isochorismatase family protein [Candidatus Limnocylindrales bacterium]
MSGAASWRDVVGPADRAIYEAAGYGRPIGPGSRPLLLVIDVTFGFVGPVRAPILESIARYPNSCGEAGWDAVAAIARLLPAARALGRPVVYSTGFAELGRRGLGLWAEKHPRAAHESPADADVIPAEIAPREDDIVLPKTKPSLFHGTPLIDLLVQLGVDTLVVTGGTTSGCVRATVVDAFSHNYRVIVVEDAVFDRAVLPHAVNLFDMDQKYATVLDSGAAVEYLTSVASPP